MSNVERRQSYLGFDNDEYGVEWRDRRIHRLFIELYGAVCAKTAGEPPHSLATCEKVPTSADEAAPCGDSEGAYPGESEADEPDYIESADDLGYVPDSLRAIRASVSRDRERQRKVLALVQAGEVAHAKRMANCNRQSVQLECGGCGSDENFVPVSCGSRLCPDCMKKKMGKVAHQYLPAVSQMDWPTMGRVSLPSRVDPDPESVEQAVDALRGAFGRLRRRVVPASGDGWDWGPWKSALHAVGASDLARVWQKRYVQQGKGIPMDEIMQGGFYGIDIKQQDDGRLNVHMHFIVDTPYLPQSALSSLWDDLIDAPVVDIRRIDDSGRNGAESALMEVIGYAAKAPEYENVDDEVAYLKALKGSKLLQPFGDLHGNTPPAPSELMCCTCERIPRTWTYLGVVDGCYETATVPDDHNDRPPPAGE